MLAKNENKFAQFNLGICYQYGLGIEKNEVKTFERVWKFS